MTRVASRPVGTTRRPFSIVALVGILSFLGVTALAGGIAMVFGWGTAETLLPDEYLQAIPVIESWVLPGLVLGIGFGVGSLITAYGVIRRPRWAWAYPLQRRTGQHWSWVASIVIGAGHVIWILLELIFLPEPSFFQPLYGAVGLALLMIPFLRSARDHLREQ
jgi:hypothetical protein